MFGASGQGRARCSEKVHPPALLPLPANDAQSAQEQLLAGDTGHLVLLKLPATAQDAIRQLPLAVWCSASA